MTDSQAAETASPSFEAGLDQLDRLVRTMESGDLGLAESIAAYEQGVALLRQLHDELGEIEQRVTTLVRLDADGNPVFEAVAGRPDPAPDETSAKPQAPASRRRGGRRSAATGGRSRPRLPGMDEPGETP